MSTYGSSKANVMAIVAESAAGTPVDPSGATEFVAMQPDFTMTPNFEQLENEEIRASIGKSKTIQGLESPEGSMSHYLKHSGTEGSYPEYDLLMESLFGSKSANGTQRVTDAASSVSVVKLTAGGGDFARGKAILVKDPTNGFNIRPVHSVSTNDLTLGFTLATAPAAGIGVGKCVNFTPTNSAHPSLTIHSYRGNGQLYDVMAGAVVSEMAIQAEAGQFINTSFSFQGTKYYFNPIRISASTDTLDFDDAAGAGPFSATLTNKLWTDPHELAEAIEDAMNAVGSVDTFTCTYLDNDATNGGKFRFTTTGANMQLLWNTGAGTAQTIGTKLGFSVAADDTGAATYTSDSAQTYAAPYTPTLDSSDPIAAKYLEVMLGDSTDYACFCAQSVGITVTNTITDVLCICAESGIDQKKATAREVKIKITALVDKYDADKFHRFKQNTETRFAFNFGPRSGGNWIPGFCGNVYVPTATISAFNLTDLETLIGVDMELTGFIDSSGNGEVYLNFL